MDRTTCNIQTSNCGLGAFLSIIILSGLVFFSVQTFKMLKNRAGVSIRQVNRKKIRSNYNAICRNLDCEQQDYFASQERLLYWFQNNITIEKTFTLLFSFDSRHQR